MQLWTKLENGIPGSLRARPNWVDDNGNPVGDDVLLAAGFLPVDATIPDYDIYLNSVEQDDPTTWEVQNDKVVVKWKIVARSDQQAIYHQRTRRNILLARSDWSQAEDIPQDKREAYSEYRQKLRDVPQQRGFPRRIVWPAEPT